MNYELRTCFLFPGQGAQSAGMAKDVAGTFRAAPALFEKANDVVGFDLQKICFEGPAEKLNTTTISQPAIFTVSAAILEVLRTSPPATHIKPDVTAGLSLGEYTALYAAGVIAFEDALLLVKKRGEAMQAAADQSEGAMVAIIGLDEEKVKALCDQAAEGELLGPVNFNCPGQIAISGTKSACERAVELAPKYEAIKAVPLQVAGAFHTSMMAPAAEALSKALADTKIADPADIKIIRNIDAEYYTSADSIRDGLTRQLTQPILWQNCMERLIADGAQSFYEIGPGKVLTSLTKRINRKANITNLSTTAAITELSTA
jgi:[acyl-carrier-protein] S-malonyltransferase